MNRTATIEYLDRQIKVTYDLQTPERETNVGYGADLIRAEYKGRKITRLIDNEKVEEKIVEMEMDEVYNS